MTDELIVILGDVEAARVRLDARGRLSLAYDAAWQNDVGAYPLSLSMPLAQAEHGHKAVDAFLWGLLPDNEIILQRWATRFQVSARNAFALLSHVGEDCAGAARFVRSDRAEEILKDGSGKVEWLDEAALAGRLRALHDDVSAWRIPSDSGQFSLAGTQPKTALFFDGKRWGVPSGRIPTTHILKPGTPGLGGHAENEHFCLALGRDLGMPVASSRFVRFEDQIAIAVERYDRARIGRAMTRVHQEDICQALAVAPGHKYENEGGPGPRAIAELLRAHSSSPDDDVDTFVSALAFNWLIAGTDAHAKNYSLLIGAEGRVRLAPLYDLASALPYEDLRQRKLKLAMKIGGKYRIHEIGAHAWSKLAAEIGFDAAELRARVVAMSARLPDAAAEILERARKEGLTHPILARLAKEAIVRAKRCSTELA